MSAQARDSLNQIYADKPASYFGNARHDIVQRLATGPESSILELGCGAGGTGRAVLAAGKASRYVGLELNPVAAEAASSILSQVVVGDVESVDLESLSGAFDALIISEVLEHLTDPWTTLARLVRCLKPGGEVFASSPNIAHWLVIKSLILGRFRYQPSGMMDQTHLRWFTPESYRELFERAGIEVVSIEPVTPLRWKARVFNAVTGKRFSHLFMTQIMISGRRRG